MKKLISALGITLAAVSMSAVAANAGAPDGGCQASGKHASCGMGRITGTIVGITVHTSASPDQRVFVRWQDTCEGVTKSGSYTARAGSRNIPHAFAEPHSCTQVEASGQLLGSGRIDVWITTN
jgi:hypothetical protein